MIKKLVRDKTPALFKENEAETITDQKELNDLYSLKIKEELAEIQHANHGDIMEFVDLIEVAYCYAEQNGFPRESIDFYRAQKAGAKGIFKDVALNNLNPNNPSNEIYFKEEIKRNFNPKQVFNNQLISRMSGQYISDKQKEVIVYDSTIASLNEAVALF